MSLESAWGNCGETAWKNNKKKKERKKKKEKKKNPTKQHKLKAQSSKHTKERAGYLAEFQQKTWKLTKKKKRRHTLSRVHVQLHTYTHSGVSVFLKEGYATARSSACFQASLLLLIIYFSSPYYSCPSFLPLSLLRPWNILRRILFPLSFFSSRRTVLQFLYRQLRHFHVWFDLV